MLSEDAEAIGKRIEADGKAEFEANVEMTDEGGRWSDDDGAVAVSKRAATAG